MKKVALAFAALAALGLALPAVGTAQAQDKVVIKKHGDVVHKKVVIKKRVPAEKKVVIHRHQPAHKKVIIKRTEG